MAVFLYQPLPNVGKGNDALLQTRFLTLLPGGQSEALRCSLEVSNIENALPYEALSYVWGSGDAVYPVSCNNMAFSIKRNLYQALRYLRFPSQPRRLWVDAICIDQGNVSERSRQVAYMTKIYRRASTVLVWLGLKSPGIKQAFQLASELAELNRLLLNAPGHIDLPQGGGELRRYHPESFSMIMAALRSKPQAAGYLMELFDRQYFERVWCVQEVQSARLCVGRCEDLEINFFDLAATTMYVEELKELTRPSTERLFSRQLWSAVSPVAPDDTPSVFSDKIPGSRGDLLTLLSAMRDLKSTDPRDKIYALLGISDEGLWPTMAFTAGPRTGSLGSTILRKAFTWTLEGINTLFPNIGILSDMEALKPDYEKPVKEVYRDITSLFIDKSCENLEVLSHVQHTKDPSENPFPSWVPNWAEARSVSIMTLDCFWAGIPPVGRYGSYAKVYIAPDDPDVIGLDGFLVDQIENVSDIMRFTPFDPLPAEQIWMQLFDGPLFPRPIRRYRNKEPLDHAFFMTLGLSPRGGWATAIPQLAKMKDSEKHAADVCRQHVKANIAAWLHQQQADISLYPELATAVETCETKEDAEAYVRWAAAFCTNRRFYLTKDGYMGIGPSLMRPGDHLCILLGGRLPFVLRPICTDYTFIREAYVYDEDILSGRTGLAARAGKGGWEIKPYVLK